MAKAPKKAKEGGGKPVVWLSGLACGVVVAIAPGLGLTAAGLLAPGLLALKLDREPGRPMARAVLTCGLAGCVQPVIAVWNAGPSVSTAASVITDPSVRTWPWAGAAAGWLLSQIMPVAVRMGLEAKAVAQIARLRAARARLTETWGLDGSGEAP